MSAIKLVIFDVAGTIVEDHGEVLHAFDIALRKHGIVCDPAELAEWKGASKREVIRHFVRLEPPPGARSADEPRYEERIEAVYADFRRILETHYQQEVTPVRGAAETFAWLRRHGIHAATTTGFYREVNNLILERAGWRDVFVASISSSDVRAGRPAPDMIFRAMEGVSVSSATEVVNIGDTPLDLQAGTNAGAHGVVGVLTGHHGRERLAREAHTHILPSVAELPALLEQEFLR